MFKKIAHPRQNKKTVVILSVSSDIGLDLARRYLKAGYRVVGTYRSATLIRELKTMPHCELFYCDISKKENIKAFVNKLRKDKLRWQVFISCVGLPQPLTSFFKTDFDRWNHSVHVNFIEQLRVLHALYPLRHLNTVVDAIFFAGPATNNAIKDMSAYAISKNALIKMCELLDAENPDLNIFIVGPGWTKTKTHYSILTDKEVSKEKFQLTRDFLFNKEGTPLEDIYACIEWLRKQGKEVAGGRNFSVVYDAWNGQKSKLLAKALRADANVYKLRRFNNDFLVRTVKQG